MAIEFVLKLDSYEDFDDDLFKILQDGKMHEVKIVTNKKSLNTILKILDSSDQSTI